MASLTNVLKISLIFLICFLKIDYLYGGETAEFIHLKHRSTLDDVSSLRIVRFSYDLVKKRLFNTQLTLLSSRRSQMSTNVNNTLLTILMCCGDIESDPGPGKTRSIRFPCTKCQKAVTARSKAVSCDGCQEWTHIKCTGSISSTMYDHAVNTDSELMFTCEACNFSELPSDPTIFEDDPVDLVTDNDHPLPSQPILMKSSMCLQKRVYTSFTSMPDHFAIRLLTCVTSPKRRKPAS